MNWVTITALVSMDTGVVEMASVIACGSGILLGGINGLPWVANVAWM